MLKKHTYFLTWYACIYSRLSFNGHLYKTDTSVKRTPRVGPCLSLLPYLILYKTGTSLRGTLSAGPKGVVERVDCRLNIKVPLNPGTTPLKLLKDKIQITEIKKVTTHAPCSFSSA